MSKTGLVVHLTLDKVLGAVGGGLAAASLGFGIYMNIHGPVAGFGTSHDFTVFAQLAPKRERGSRTHADPAAPSAEPLDMTATASIPKPSSAETSRPDVAASATDDLDAGAQVISSFTLEAASADSAMISIEGRTRMVRVGDTVPGAGEILEIRAGRRAAVRTSRGLILSARRD